MVYLGDWLHKTRSRLTNGWVLPARCAICRRWPSENLCDTCIAAFASPTTRCPTCGLAVCAPQDRCTACDHHPSLLTRCVCAVDYGWPWQGLIARFKFHDEPGWAQPLAWLMRSAYGGEDLLHAADLVLPMPVSRERLAERGYNQSWLLAKALARQKADARLLLRVRHTPAQHTLNRAHRLANLQGSMALEPLRAHEVRGRHLLLIDDVMTSGASLQTAAQVLIACGAQQVSALVLARTGPHEGDEETIPAAPTLRQSAHVPHRFG